MKAILMMAVLLGAAVLTAEDVVLNTWDLSKGQCALHREKGVEAKSGFADGAYRVEVLKNLDKKTGNNIQFWCNSNQLKAGVKYRVDFTVKSSADAKITGTVMLTNKPWTRVVGKNVSLKAGEAAELSLEFSLKEDATSGYRTPGLFLGEADPGTVFEISDIKLLEVK